MTVEHDKLDIHNRQQLSALMDGELSPDEARFLLRRLQHDEELGSAWERWQLCGDVLRGQATAPAPAGFAARVAQAVAAEPRRHAAHESAAPRGRLLRWGGGAIAASVALVALFMARQTTPQDDAASVAPTIAATSTSPVSTPEAVTSADAGTLADAGAAEGALASAAAATVAVASVPRRDANTRRGATRTQQAARGSITRAQPQRAVASARPPVAAPTAVLAGSAGAPASVATRADNPFSSAPMGNAPAARPWPRSTLSQYPAAAGALTTGYSSDAAARTFYPFEPFLPAQAPRP